MSEPPFISPSRRRFAAAFDTAILDSPKLGDPQLGRFGERFLNAIYELKEAIRESRKAMPILDDAVRNIVQELNSEHVEDSSAEKIENTVFRGLREKTSTALNELSRVEAMGSNAPTDEFKQLCSEITEACKCSVENLSQRKWI